MYRIYFYLALALCSHYVSTVPTILTRTQSVTNIDSNYVPITGHAGTLSDSLADSLFMPILANGLTGGYGPTHMDIGVQCADTLTDSIVVVAVSNGRNRVYTKKLYEGSNDVYFGIQWSSGSAQGKPDLYEFQFKMKQKAGKGAHIVRITPNFLQQP